MRQFKISNSAEEYIEELKTDTYILCSFFDDLHVIEHAAYLDLKSKLEIATEALKALSSNSNFCMGEYIGKNNKLNLMSDVAIAIETLKKIGVES